MKLGEILIKKGLLTQTELDAALKSQLILGGHLGTSLIEMGFIDEDTLGEILSEQYGAPYAAQHLFERIGETTIKAVPAKIAEEYLAIPIKLDDKFVHLAVVDPRDLRIVDELAFAIGRKIIPWVAPEVRIYQALETYYGVPRKPRFITLGVQLDDAMRRNRTATAKASAARGEATTAATPAVDSTSTSPAPAAEASATDDVNDLAFGYGKTWQEIADDLDRRETRTEKKMGPSAAEASRPAMPNGDAERKSAVSLLDLAKRFCAAEAPDDLARAAMEFSAGRAARLLLMNVRAGRATVWHERGFALTNETRRAATFQVSFEAIFRLVVDTDRYHGPVPEGDEFHSFYRALSAPAPAEILIVPIRINGLLIAVAVADGGTKAGISGQIEELTTAFQLFSMSINLLGMKRKIVDTAKRGAEVATAQATATAAGSLDEPVRQA